ncbi:hypothetical protein [Amycolatopsis sp. DSM 110486]|uniref:hypothetical protein n=1 Tax=Amycolatopsis sp. DSM 110486 TaxID=2865832 RepID=UPI001C6A618A|nr:hypothetical protein [Amycolatopsis sp. DSM 110486]QYN17522.1 hypothetical protein K1T34_32570 [Amycolatopsis sp. DSM 110486]
MDFRPGIISRHPVIAAAQRAAAAADAEVYQLRCAWADRESIMAAEDRADVLRAKANTLLSTPRATY